MFTFIIGGAAFVYLLSRINNLESSIHEQSRSDISPAPISVTQAPSVPKGTVAEEIHTPIFAPIVSEKLKDAGTTEFAFGSKVFTFFGIIALLAGVGFFLRYAFENNYITEGMRVGLGVVLGIVMISLGAWLRKKYTTYGESLFGAGLGILYVSIYAAYSFYGLIGVVSAFALLFTVTILGLVMSLMYDSLPLVSYSLAGAYIITFLLPFAANVHTFFIYMLMLNALVVGVTSIKRWPQLTFASLIATFCIVVSWMFGHYTDAVFAPTSLYLTVLCGAHSITVISNFLRRRGEYKDVDGILLPGLPIIYILLHFMMIHTNDGIALLMFFVGLIYIAGCTIVRAIAVSMEQKIQQEHADGKACSNIMLLIGSVCIAAAIGYHFNGVSITYLWALEGLALVVAGSVLHSARNRITGIIISMVALFRMYDFDYLRKQSTAPIFNGLTVITFVMLLVFVAIYLFYRYRKGQGETFLENEYTYVTNLSLVVAYIIPLVWMTSEIYDWVKIDTQIMLAIAWMIYGLCALSLGFLLKEIIARYLSYFLIGIALFLGFIQTWNLSLPHTFLINTRGLVMGLGIITVTTILALLKQFRHDISEDEYNMSTLALVVLNGIILCLGSFEIVDYYNGQIGAPGGLSENTTTLENIKRVVLSLFYLAYGACALAIGIVRKSYFARIVAFVLFGIAIFKIFLYDTANLSDIYRFVSFIALGVILLVASYAYYRFKSRIMEFVQHD